MFQDCQRYSPFTRSRVAFTLIELIGLVAVLAVLAAILVPNLVRQLDRIAAEKETAALRSLAEALKDSIVRNHYIPTYTNWQSIIAAQLGAGIANVTTNSRNRPRFFLVDPEWKIGPTTAGQSYQQANLGAPANPKNINSVLHVPPTSPRLIILSSIGQPLPNMASGVPSSNDFNAIWDWNDSSQTPPSASLLAGLGSTRGDDLRVQRLNLAPLFVRLILTTYGSTANPAYAIDSANHTNSTGIDTLEPVDSYFIRGSVLSLFIPPFTPPTLTNSPTLDSQQVLVRDSSYVYNEDKWRNSIIGGPTIGGLDFIGVVDRFLKTPPNLNPNTLRDLNGTNQQSVLVTNMMSYMGAYIAWSANFADSVLKDAARSAQATMITSIRQIYEPGGGNNDYTPWNTNACVVP